MVSKPNDASEGGHLRVGQKRCRRSRDFTTQALRERRLRQPLHHQHRQVLMMSQAKFLGLRPRGGSVECMADSRPISTCLARIDDADEANVDHFGPAWQQEGATAQWGSG